MSDYSDGALVPTIPPPEWIENENVTCYSPHLVHNINALDDENVSGIDLFKSFLILVTSVVTILSNIIFITVLNSR